MEQAGGPTPTAGLAAIDNPRRERLRSIILEHGYLRRSEPFQLSSGGMSYDYVDIRRALAHGADLAAAAGALSEALAESAPGYQAIGGMTMGADPIAHAVALTTSCAWFSVRKQEKRYGAGRRIEGAELSSASRVVLVEDTVSTGRSLLEALDIVLETGARVLAACTLLDRGELARPRVEERDVPYLALLTYRDLGIEPIGDPTAAMR